VRSIYKKVDSVLRGPIAAELEALLAAWGLGRCLLVPANPGLGRVIAGGEYLVQGIPLHETDFALDPEYPAQTASVMELVGATGGSANASPLFLLSPGDALPQRGIAIGEASTTADLASWATLAAHPGVLAAGASEFFGAYLCALGHMPADRACEAECDASPRDLFVCGSTSASSRTFCQESEERGVPVFRLPSGLLRQLAGDAKAASETAALVAQWAGDVIGALERHPRVIIAIDRPLCPEPGVPRALGEYLGEAVERVLEKATVDRLFAEGGATAVALVRRMGVSRMRVCREWATGVVSLEAVGDESLLLSMKPGSYVWPEAILRV
jgi:uncharacterized protein YgbK (DUF1537 family)